MAINWNVNKRDQQVIFAVAMRAVAALAQHGVNVKLSDMEMDITATHANGCPLRLTELLAADSYNFLHDIQGIARHIDRDTGKLQNCFIPRFAA